MFDATKITLYNWEDIRPCVKRPVIVHACQMALAEGFFVKTLEGIIAGKPGDYLIIGVNGEKYPCAKDVFEKTYDFIELPAE